MCYNDVSKRFLINSLLVYIRNKEKNGNLVKSQGNERFQQLHSSNSSLKIKKYR